MIRLARTLSACSRRLLAVGRPADAQQMAAEDSGLTEEQRAVATRIHEAGLRIAQDIKRITELSIAPVTNYPGGAKMVDLDAARKRKR